MSDRVGMHSYIRTNISYVGQKCAMSCQLIQIAGYIAVEADISNSLQDIGRIGFAGQVLNEPAYAFFIRIQLRQVTERNKLFFSFQ